MRSPTPLLLLAVAAGVAVAEDSPSAFRFPIDKNVRSAIDLEEVKRGIRGSGDPRDKIPAIDDPKHVSVKQANAWLTPKARVLGVVVGGEARAYPIFVLERHEMVNDTLGGRPIGPNY